MEYNITMIKRHDAFIGRWITFHKGHLEIIKKVYNKNKRPILILIMDTNEIPYANHRIKQIEIILQKEKIPATFHIIPPISSINWGRNVGYETNYIEVDEEIKQISGTKIREKICNNDDSWKKDIP